MVLYGLINLNLTQTITMWNIYHDALEDTQVLVTSGNGHMIELLAVRQHYQSTHSVTVLGSVSRMERNIKP